jgi:hypothetical protein
MLTRLQLAELRELPLWAGLGDSTEKLLMPNEIAFATKIGNRRQDTAIARKLRNNNGLAADRRHDRWIHIVGARCEMAAWKYFGPIHWNWNVYDITDKPDLSNWIEIKGRDVERYTWLVVPPKKGMGREGPPPREWAYVLVNGCNHPIYRIVGWRWGWEFLDDDHWDEVALRERPAWCAKPPFRPPSELLEHVRLREE